MSKTHKNKLVFLTGNTAIPGHIQDFKELLNDEDYNLDFKTYSDIYPGEAWNHEKQSKIIDECEFIIILGENCIKDTTNIVIGKGNYELINSLPIGKKCYITCVSEVDWYRMNNVSYCTVHSITPSDDSITVLGSDYTDYKKWAKIDRCKLEDIDLDSILDDFQESFNASLVKSNNSNSESKVTKESDTQDEYIDPEDLYDWSDKKNTVATECNVVIHESRVITPSLLTSNIIVKPTSCDAKSSNFDNSNGIKGMNFLELKTGKGKKPFTGLSNVNFIKLKKRIF